VNRSEIDAALCRWHSARAARRSPCREPATEDKPISNARTTWIMPRCGKPAAPSTTSSREGLFAAPWMRKGTAECRSASSRTARKHRERPRYQANALSKRFEAGSGRPGLAGSSKGIPVHHRVQRRQPQVGHAIRRLGCAHEIARHCRRVSSARSRAVAGSSRGGEQVPRDRQRMAQRLRIGARFFLTQHCTARLQR
jgi:hypothetical protein